MLREYLKRIADATRSALGIEGTTINAQDFPTKIAEVYESGKTAGMAVGYTDGRDCERNLFWGTLQNHGGEMDYSYCFAYGRFTDDNYNPQYDIVCAPKPVTSAYYMFYNAAGITDTKVPIHINGTNATRMFRGCDNLVTIRKLTVHEGVVFTESFYGCSALRSLTVDGIIGTDINLQWSPLDAESGVSVLSHLKNFSGDADNFGKHTVTLSEHTWALIDALGSITPSGPDWRNYVRQMGWNDS